VAETLDWARALVALERRALDEAGLRATIGTVVKYREDADRVLGAGLGDLVARVRARGVER
jgi:hypothetical protein